MTIYDFEMRISELELPEVLKMDSRRDWADFEQAVALNGCERIEYVSQQVAQDLGDYDAVFSDAPFGKINGLNELTAF